MKIAFDNWAAQFLLGSTRASHELTIILITKAKLYKQSAQDKSSVLETLNKEKNTL